MIVGACGIPVVAVTDVPRTFDVDVGFDEGVFMIFLLMVKSRTGLKV